MSMRFFFGTLPIAFALLFALEAHATIESKLTPYQLVACPAIYAPVCGSDGKTYDNDCQAKAKGITSVTRGECDPKGPLGKPVQNIAPVPPRTPPSRPPIVLPRPPSDDREQTTLFIAANALATSVNRAEGLIARLIARIERLPGRSDALARLTNAQVSIREARALIDAIDASGSLSGVRNAGQIRLLIREALREVRAALTTY